MTTTTSHSADSESIRRRVAAWISRLADAVRDGDEADIARAIQDLSSSRRYLTPLAYSVGGVAMLIGGVRILFSNWRLTLIQILPALWIWLAMYDLRVHVLHDWSFREPDGLVLAGTFLTIVAITIVVFFLNAVFGFAISQHSAPSVRAAVVEARSRPVPIVAAGAILGIGLASAVTIAPRAGPPWFAVSMSVVLALMMVAYVAVPARLVGVGRKAPRRDRISASLVGGALGAAICAPPYILGRIGLLMIGAPVLRVPGVLLFIAAATLQAGATGAIRAVKMGARLSVDEPGIVEPSVGPSENGLSPGRDSSQPRR